MERLLEKIIQCKENGLYFVNTPTGSAKSYNAVQLMKNHYQSFDSHFIFITNNLNNLPMEDLEKAFGDDFKNQVIRVESIVDNIVHHFDERIIPDEYKRLKYYKELYNSLNNYKSLADTIQCELDKGKTPNIGLLTYFDQSKEDLANKDSSFRKDIRKHLMKSGFAELNFEERKAIVKSKYKWLTTLYPAIFIEDYKVICMSVKRFFTYIDSIYMKNYRFSESEIIDHSVLFIDEVDATKNEINNIILESSLKSTIDLIPMIHRIADQFIYWDQNMPRALRNLVTSKNEEFNKARHEALDIRKKYHDELPYYCSQIKNRNFLMSDATFHANFEDHSKKNAYSYYDTNKNQMTIEIENSRNNVSDTPNEIYSLFSVIRDMNHFLLTTKYFFNKLAGKYKNYKNEESKEEDQINDEEALHSIYKVFRLTDADISYFNNEIHIRSQIKINKDQKRFKKTNGYYNRGIRSFEFTNQKKDSLNTSFNYIYLSQSAERILVLLAKKAIVIGLSATCNIDSVLSNYSLRYLKENLEDSFHLIGDEDHKRIKDTYSMLNKKYESKDIQVHIEEVMNCLNLDKKGMIHFVFEDFKIQRKVERIFSCNDITKEFKVKRYLIMAQVYRYFIVHKDIQSFLCLNNALPKENGEFNLSILLKLFDAVNEENSFDKNDVHIEVLKSGISFDADKKDILERLSNGEKVFVISAYATIGAGQNMAYKLPEHSDTINLTDFSNQEDGRNYKKDFDGIYLGDITNVVTNLLDMDSDFDESELLNCLIELENLYENNEITHHTLNKGIQSAYEKLKNPKTKLFLNEIQGCRSVRLFKTKQIIQAIGRLSRSFNKNKTIHILVTKDIVHSFDTTVLENEILSPETMQLAKYAKERQQSIPVYDYVENKACKISSEGKFYIYELLPEDWNEEKIRLYKELGETCLKYPTSSYLDNEIVKEYYIHSHDPFNKYYFVDVKDFEYTDIFFNETKDEAKLRIQNGEKNKEWLINYLHEVSEDNCRLTNMLNYPGLKDEFEKHGYATCFEENDYMLSPVLYQNIYKGRLGEFVGKYIIKKELGIDLKELDTDEFERFDFKYGDIYIDFKHWRYSSYSWNTMSKKILNKLDEVHGKKVLVINIFDEKDTDQIMESERIIEIPSLLEKDGFHANQDAINTIRKCLKDERND